MNNNRSDDPSFQEWAEHEQEKGYLKGLKEMQKIAESHQRVLFILGVAMSMIISECKGHNRYKWLMQAIENVVYKNEPMPEMPE